MLGKVYTIDWGKSVVETLEKQTTPWCPTKYRWATPAEAKCESEFLRQYGGQEISHCSLTPYGWVVAIGGSHTAVDLLWVVAETTHDFPNTGAKRSWCNHCGVVGYFHFQSGEYKPE